MTTTETVISILVIAACTLLTRALPFVIFSGKREIPQFIKYLGDVLPYAIIGMLVIYCLKSVDVTQFPFGVCELAAIAFIVAVHKWKHNLLLSILGGTAIYMVLIRVL